MSHYREVVRLIASLTADERAKVLRVVVEGMPVRPRIDAEILRWTLPRGSSWAEMRAHTRTTSATTLRLWLYSDLAEKGYSLGEIGAALDRHHDVIRDGIRSHRARQSGDAASRSTDLRGLAPRERERHE